MSIMQKGKHIISNQPYGWLLTNPMKEVLVNKEPPMNLIKNEFVMLASDNQQQKMI